MLEALGPFLYLGLSALDTQGCQPFLQETTLGLASLSTRRYQGAGSPKYKKVIEGWEPLVQRNN